MKKLFISLVICCVVSVLQAQTFVSTTPANKNVILEEFTGRNCTNCPGGHKKSAEITAANKDRAFLINIHAGVLSPTATPNYNTSFGTAIHNQLAVGNYPSAVVNRHPFPGRYSTSLFADFDSLRKNVDTVLSQRSCVNVAAQSTIDLASRELIVNVEVFYTSSSSKSTNKLNVVLVQNNILGPQEGKENNPSEVVGSQYRHQHMLRHILTGNWGENITTTTAGSFIKKQYTYTIPEHLNNITYELLDLEVIVFVAEGEREIISGAKSSMSYFINAPYIHESKEIETYQCNQVRMEHLVKNQWSNKAVTSLDFEYTYGGDTYPFAWTGNIAAGGGTAIIQSPLIPITSGTTLPVAIRLVANNGEPAEAAANISEVSFRKTPYNVTSNPLVFKFVTDRYASDCSFKFFNNEGTVLQQDGHWANLQSADTTVRIFTLNLTNDGCYKLEVYDTAGNGVNSALAGLGFLEILDTTGKRIAYNNGRYGSQADFYFNYTHTTTTEIDNIENIGFNIYPNPANGVLHIESPDRVEVIVIYNMQGQQVLKTSCFDGKVNINALANGLYILQASTQKGVVTKKFVVLQLN